MDRSALGLIVEAAAVGPGDTVLEIGPGLGVLTDALARRAKRIVAVELDARMRQVLDDLVAWRSNVDVVAADIRAVDPAALVGRGAAPKGPCRGFLVVANLPYYITSAVLRHVLEAPVKPERAVVMVQREVAERILAAPGAMSVLGVAVQFYAAPARVAVVPAAGFYPAPKVDSMVLRLDVHQEPPVPVPDEALFFRVVRAGFSLRRKQLRNAMASGLEIPRTAAGDLLRAADVDPERRAQTLSVAEWAAVAAAAANAGSRSPAEERC